MDLELLRQGAGEASSASNLSNRKPSPLAPKATATLSRCSRTRTRRPRQKGMSEEQEVLPLRKDMICICPHSFRPF